MLNELVKIAFLAETKRLGRVAKESPGEFSGKMIGGTIAGTIAGILPALIIGAKRGNKAGSKFINDYLKTHNFESANTLSKLVEPIVKKEMSSVKGKMIAGGTIAGMGGSYLGTRSYFKKRGIKTNPLSPFIKAQYSQEAEKKYLTN